MNKKILISLSVIAAVAAIAIGVTMAYFSDTETSTGNTFTAGTLDLKVDSECHYNGRKCVNSLWTGSGTYPSGACSCTWAPTDLGGQKFFNFTDIKPGDSGEDTISLTVDNDAWLRLVIRDVTDLDNSCTEPEGVAEHDVTCGGATTPGAGELRENLLFTVWQDYGMLQTPGATDPLECDNILNGDEYVLISEGPINAEGEIWDLTTLPAPGNYLWAGIKGCLGISWRLPTTVGNEVQSDSMSGTMEFQVQQHRNNPTPSWVP